MKFYPLRFIVLALATASFAVMLAALPSAQFEGDRSVILTERAAAQQVIRTGELWQKVYQLLPDLPLENQYINRETGEVAQSNTLISRLIRYHTFSKGRTPAYRLDWKLTLADYLGMNERMSTSAYPGADALRTNPLEGDMAAVRALSRVQRDALVDALVAVFRPDAPNSSTTPALPAPVVSPSASPSPVSPPAAPRREPRPGDANLLLNP